MTDQLQHLLETSRPCSCSSADAPSAKSGQEHDFRNAETSHPVSDQLRFFTTLERVGAEANAAPGQRRTAILAIGDWDALFCAVNGRLRLTAKGRLPTTPAQSIVLECADALDQLHTALTNERSLRHQLEQEVFEAKTALAQLRTVIELQDRQKNGHAEPSHQLEGI